MSGTGEIFISGAVVDRNSYLRTHGMASLHLHLPLIELIKISLNRNQILTCEVITQNRFEKIHIFITITSTPFLTQIVKVYVCNSKKVVKSYEHV